MPEHRRPAEVVWRNRFPIFTDDSPDPDAPSPTTGADMVTSEDPAFNYICRAAMQLGEFGFDPADPDIARRAIEVGRGNYALEVSGVLPRRFADDPDVAKMPTRTEVVYYMRIGNRVKIGWSTNLASRLAAINPEELLATEVGGRDLERMRHREFAQLHTHGEWFQMQEPLISHIAKLNRDTA